jgi:hypothetical protein
MLLMLLNGGVRDLAGLVSSDTYWKSKDVTVSIEQLTGELQAVKPVDVSKLIGDLDADDPKARDDAAAKIAAYGAGALPALAEAAKNGSPEVVARANAISAKIRGGAKPAAVRRLMAIRTLGEMKNASALPLLRTLVDSKEMFEADYAKAAIARIEGNAYNSPVATDANRAADVALLPSRLDIVAQIAPQFNGLLPIDKLIDQAPVPEDQKAKSREEAHGDILKLLETVGNVRLDAITWGFYAAPPGVPGNTVVIARGTFDETTVAEALAQAIPRIKKVNDVEVFQMDDDSVLLLPNDGRIIFLAREPTGDLGLEAMTAALRKGAGDFSANPDLSGLIKSVDTKSPLWAVTKMASGLRELAGPFGQFDTVTITASQAVENDKIISNLQLQAEGPDAAKTKDLVDTLTAEIKSTVLEGRKEEKTTPYLKPMVDFVDSLKLTADGKKATMTGSLHDMPMVPAMMMMERQVDVRQQ